LHLPIKEALKDTFKITFMKRKLLSKKCARIKNNIHIRNIDHIILHFLPFYRYYYSKLLLHSIVPTSPRGPRFLRPLLFSTDPVTRGPARTMHALWIIAPARVCICTNVTKHAFAFNGEFLGSKRAFKRRAAWLRGLRRGYAVDIP